LAIIGIDFGSSRLRVAVGQDEKAAMVDHPYVSQRVPFIVKVSDDERGGRASRCQIISLKRLLDFDTAIPIPPAGVKSIDYLARLFSEVNASIGNTDDVGGMRYVLAVPPCFSQRQRSALRTAATQAELAPVRLVDDTLAALQASRESLKAYERIMVFSWGASACSVGVYRATNKAFIPIGQDGNRNLGGDDADGFIGGLLMTALEESIGSSWQEAKLDLVRLAQEAEIAKRLLGHGKAASVSLSDLLKSSASQMLRRQSVKLPGNVCQSLFAEMIAQTITHAEKALKAADCSRPDVILVTGGMTRIPDIRKMLTDCFDAPICDASEEAVAVGAVLYGNMLPEAEWPETEPVLGNRMDASKECAKRSTVGMWADHFVPILDEAQQLEAEGKLGEAIQTFERLFAELYKFSGSLYRRFASMAEKEGRLDDAFELLKLAHIRNPSDSTVAMDFADVCLKRATNMYSKRKYDLALEDANLGATAIRNLSSGSKMHSHLLAQLIRLNGLALYALGRLPEAKKAIEEAVRLSPDEKLYQKDLAKIREDIKQASSARTSGARGPRVGRNDPCPCGSGLKYKKCCGV